MPYPSLFSLRQLKVICTPLCNKTISVTSCTNQERVSGSRNKATSSQKKTNAFLTICHEYTKRMKPTLQKLSTEVGDLFRLELRPWEEGLT